MTSLFQHTPMATVIDVRETGVGVTGKFLSDRSFADLSAHKSFRENYSGNIAVLANCKSLSVFNANRCRGITGKFLGSFFSRASPLTNRSAKIIQVTSPSWPIASRCRCLTPIGAGASLVSFSRIVLFADQSAYKSFRENSQVTSPSWPIASRCRCFTHTPPGASLVSFSRIVLFADQSAHKSFREKSYANRSAKNPW